MAKKNKNFKKPVNNQETIIDEDEKKRKKLIVIVCLSIVIILGIIIASITYFNGIDEEEDKDNNKDKNKPTEIIKPEENDNPVISEPDKPVVKTPLVVKPKDDVAATPGEVDKETPISIKSVDENDYEVEMNGNTAIVKGVSRYVAISSEAGVNNVITLKVVLDSKYSREQLEKLVVTTTTNGVTTNDFDYVIEKGETINEDGSINEELYFYWAQPVGNGQPKPTSFTVNYGDGNVQTYDIDLSLLKVESEVSKNEKDLVVVPTDTDAVYAGNHPYDIEIFRQLSSDEIVWLEPSEASLDENSSLVEENVVDNSNTLEVTNELTTNETTLETESNPIVGEVTNTPIEEPDYSKDLNYTVKFNMKDTSVTNPDGTVTENWDGVLVVKVYAPVILEETTEIDGTTTKTNKVVIDPSKVVITGIEQTIDSVKIEKDENNNDRYYTYLSYDTTKDETLNNQSFTIDWDAEKTNYGKYTYEFDLSDLRDNQENTQEIVTTNLEQEEGTEESEAELPNELNEIIDTPADTIEQPEPTEALSEVVIETQSEIDGTLN